VPFENLGSIEPALRAKGHQLSCTHIYNNQPLPSVNDIDWLIIMGGPMGVNEEDKYPWLREEKRLIKDAIFSEKIVLGICLGAQLIADSLGARIYKNNYREIGWFGVDRLPGADKTILNTVLPKQVEVFHWHGDTFDIPGGANAIFESKACKNQGFILHDRVLALQFHLETTPSSAVALIENCRNELDGSCYVQSTEEIIADARRFLTINKMMCSVLDALETARLRKIPTI
jgi:GMP synthase (glutamine-hydrolysing)